MKISSQKKLLIAVATFFLFGASQCYAWNGYDYDNKTEIEIGPGNTVREGLIIQFYDSKIDNFHTAKVLFMDQAPGGTRIQLQDLDSKKERTFIMQDD